MNGLAVCSGVGGVELGVRIATRGSFRVVCHVEREAYAAATLVARMEEKALDSAPVWDDLTTFDGVPWRGLVDCVTAGIPCQPYSVAGKRLGHADERALWPELVRIVRECEPAFVFLENTPDFLHYFGPVWTELWSMGFECAPPLLQTASEFGGPHERERIFILAAHSARQRWRERGSESARLEGRSNVNVFRSDETSNAYGARLERQSRNEDRGGGRTREIGSSTPNRQLASDANSGGSQIEWSGWLFDRERQTLRHDADRCGPGCRICGSHWEAESPPVRLDAGFPGWVDELRAIGNSVIPDMAAAAWTYLISYLT